MGLIIYYLFSYIVTVTFFIKLMVNDKDIYFNTTTIEKLFNYIAIIMFSLLICMFFLPIRIGIFLYNNEDKL